MVAIAQNAQEVFGKNKVQYNDDLQEWWIYETSNIIYYWYGKSRKVAEFYIRLAESENKKIRDIFEFHLKDKFELVIYSDLTDLYQTNIDLESYLTTENWNEEPRVVGQKVLLYFDGNHQNALKLLRKGLMKIYFNSIFSGSQIEEAVQKVISLKLPDWFEKGLVDYLSESWSEKDLLYMKSILYTSKNPRINFRRFNSRSTLLAGKSMWNYIVQTYGQQSISNWLYMTRIQKDLNQATKLTFQRTLKNLYADWAAYYQHELSNIQIPELNATKIRLKKEEDIHDVYYSELFKKYIFESNQNGKKRIRLLTEKGKTKIIYSSGHRNKITIPSMRLPIYGEVNDRFFVIDERRNRFYLFQYNQNGQLIDKSILPEEIQEVYDLAATTKNELYITANNNGFSDVFRYIPGKRQFQKITDDIYDDLQLQKSKGSVDTGLLILNTARPDLYSKVKDLDSSVPIYPYQLIHLNSNNQSKSNFHHYSQLGSVEDFESHTNFNYTKNRSNAGEFFFITYDTTSLDISEPFLHLVGSNQENRINKIYKKPNHKYYYEINDLPKDDLSMANKPLYNLDSTATIGLVLNDSMTRQDVPLISFESKFGDPDNVQSIISEFFKKKIPFKISDLKNNEKEYIPSTPLIRFNSNQAIAYRDRFSMEDWSTTFNNDLLFGGLNTYTGISPTYRLPRPGILFKTKLQETFENYQIEFGLRIPTSFVGSEAFLLYNNYKFRWDHSIGLYRKSDRNSVPFGFNNEYQLVEKTFLINYIAKYAFDHYKSIRINNTIRNDYLFLKASDRTSLDSSGKHIQSIGCRLEYVYDDALNLAINLKEGSQIKLFFETTKRFQTTFRDGLKFNNIPGILLVAGMDARHHFPVLRHSVWSNRLYINSSFGSQRILNQLGGTENWLLFTKFNTDSPSEDQSSYAFSQLVTEVRGNAIGARKGSSALVYSSELRVPFFQYLLTQNWKNSFLRNLQFVGFVDIGLSWNGFIPDASDIVKYQYTAENPSVKLEITYNRDPIIAGTGIGLRSSIFGYFIRFDYAWPIAEFTFGRPIPHISLGLDF